MNEGVAVFVDQLLRRLFAFACRRAAKHHFRAILLRRFNLAFHRIVRHDDRRFNAEQLRRKRDSLPMVPR